MIELLKSHPKKEKKQNSNQLYQPAIELLPTIEIRKKEKKKS